MMLVMWLWHRRILDCGQRLGSEEGLPGHLLVVWFRELLGDGLAAFFLLIGVQGLKALIIPHGHLEKYGKTKSLKVKALVGGPLAFKWQSEGMTLEHPFPWAVSCESAGQPRILSAVFTCGLETIWGL